MISPRLHFVWEHLFKFRSMDSSDAIKTVVGLLNTLLKFAKSVVNLLLLLGMLASILCPFIELKAGKTEMGLPLVMRMFGCELSVVIVIPF